MVRAVEELDTINLMPVYGMYFSPGTTLVCNTRLPNNPILLALFSAGLNVLAMLRHETLVLTVAAAKKIEEKILQCMLAMRKQAVNVPQKLDHFG